MKASTLFPTAMAIAALIFLPLLVNAQATKRSNPKVADKVYNINITNGKYPITISPAAKKLIQVEGQTDVSSGDQPWINLNVKTGRFLFDGDPLMAGIALVFKNKTNSTIDSVKVVVIKKKILQVPKKEILIKGYYSDKTIYIYRVIQGILVSAGTSKIKQAKR